MTILEKLVRAHGKSVFFRMEVGGSDFYPEGEKGVVFFQRPGSTVWQPLLSIASRVSAACCFISISLLPASLPRKLQRMMKTSSSLTHSCCSLARCVRYSVLPVSRIQVRVISVSRVTMSSVSEPWTRIISAMSRSNRLSGV